MNDHKLIETSLKERWELLESKQMFTTQEGRLMLSQRMICSTIDDLAKHATDSVEAGEEGILIKKFDSTYKLDTRSGGGWFKWKPECVAWRNRAISACAIGPWLAQAMPIPEGSGCLGLSCRPCTTAFNACRYVDSLSEHMDLLIVGGCVSRPVSPRTTPDYWAAA